MDGLTGRYPRQVWGTSLYRITRKSQARVHVVFPVPVKISYVIQFHDDVISNFVILKLKLKLILFHLLLLFNQVINRTEFGTFKIRKFGLIRSLFNNRVDISTSASFKHING